MTEIKAEEENKKVLIIGNGFDLAHGLPTSYRDFFAFAEKALAIYDSCYTDYVKYSEAHLGKWRKSKHTNENENTNKRKQNYNRITQQILNDLGQLFQKNKENKQKQDSSKKNSILPINNDSLDRMNYFYDQLNNNIWYRYIKRLKIYGETWIDFESEVATIIQIIDKSHTSLDQNFLELVAILNIEKNAYFNASKQKFDIFYGVYKKFTKMIF